MLEDQTHHCTCNLGLAGFDLQSGHVVQDALLWNATYIVRGRQAIFGAFQLWCALNHIEVKINRIGEFLFCRQDTLITSLHL